MSHCISFAVAIVAGTAIALAGCDSQQTDSEDGTLPADKNAPAEGEHADHVAGEQTHMEKMKTELAKLSPEDRASAEKQHFCPVSGEMLGTMGPPLKVEVNGQQVWICCESCREPLLEDPEEYLAKLKSP